MSVCAAAAALLLLALVHPTAGAQLQPQGSAGSGSQGQEPPLQARQPDTVATSQLEGRQSQQVISAQQPSLGQPEAADSGAANPSVQIQDGAYGREDSAAQSPNADVEAPGVNDWIPPNGYIPYPVPAAAEQPPGNPQYEEPRQFAVPYAAYEDAPGPYADAAANQAFQAWYAAQRQQRKPPFPLPYVFNYYPRVVSNTAEGYAPHRHRPAGGAAASGLKNEAPTGLSSMRNNDNVEVADGWPKDVLVPFPSNLAQSELGSQVPHDSSIEGNAFPEAIPGAGAIDNKTGKSRAARDESTKSTHSDKGLAHYRKSSSKPHYAKPQEFVDPANFVLGNILPGSILAGIGPRGNISGKDVPINISAYAKAPGDFGPLPAFLLPPTQVIHAGNNLTLFYFQLDNSTLKSKPGFSALRSEVSEHATNNVAKDEHAEDHHSEHDHEEDHHRENDHGPSDHAVEDHAEIGHAGEGDHVVGSDSHGDKPADPSEGAPSPSLLNRAQRSADDGTFLGKLSEWACLGRTVNGETVYCDSILDYARLVAVLGTATIVVTIIFVLLIHGWARKDDDEASRKKAPADAAADDEERTPLRARNDEGADDMDYDFRADKSKRLLVEFLKRDIRRKPL
ncbi:hypothetical protein V5799_019720 [Amblyomma americanum]|uniref:Uncharacterized protein n=1 Tax=Amblyomma americanum TaxID=6943 RepID=A0AAQ4EW62_AMBAM